MKILLLQVAGMHLGYVGCYGNDWVSTPTLDRLAAESVVFDHHIADCLEQWPSAWTGQYRFPWLTEESLPTPSSLRDLLPAQGVPLIHIPESQLLAARHINPASYHEEIRQALQGAFVGLEAAESWFISLELPSLLPPWLVGEDYLMHYFRPDEPGEPTDEGEEQEIDDEEEGFEDEEVEEEDEEEAAAEVDQETDEADESRHAAEFSWANEPLEPSKVAAEDGDVTEVPGMLWPLLDPPLGFLKPEDGELLERLQLSYAAAMSQTDAYLHTALEQLHARGLVDEVLLIVTTERGLALGEHGVVGDAKPWLHEELLHLPLLIRIPHAEQAGRRVSALTQPVDLFPTILEAFGIISPAHHGHSIFPLLRGTATTVREYACTGLKLDQEAEFALRTPGWSVVLPEEGSGPRRSQLFAKPEDRWEVNNVRQHHLDLAEQLEQTLQAWAKTTIQPEPFTPPELGKLTGENG